MISNVCPNVTNLSETLSTLNFSARARNAVLSLGNRDTIKKWRDVVSSSKSVLPLEIDNETYIQLVPSNASNLKSGIF